MSIARKKQQAHALMQQNRLREARALFTEVCNQAATDWESWHLLCAVNGMLGDIAAAEACARKVVALQPRHHGAWTNLGNCLMARGDEAGALDAFQRALRLNPRDPQVLVNLGTLLGRQGKPEAALQHFERALKIDPRNPHAQNNLGHLYQQMGRLEEAEACYRRAVAIQPDFPEACCNLAGVLGKQGAGEEALRLYEHAARLRPASAEPWLGMADVLREQGRLEEALDHCRKALDLGPDDARIHGALGTLYYAQGRMEEATRAYREALRLDPDNVEAQSNLLMTLVYGGSLAPREVFEEHRRWGERHAALAGEAPPRARKKGPLRVGYISPDFRSHPVADFIEPVLRHHDAARFEIHCYADFGLHPADSTTGRLRALVPRWRDITGLPDERVAAMIREDGIDILVDLAGHTAGNRLLVLARRPAPVQVSYLGYPHSTGLAAVDYHLTDDVADPEGADALYTERLWRLESGFFCYWPPEQAPPVGPLPADGQAALTFGSLNTLSKLNDAVVGLWARVLAAVPHSRLLIYRDALGESARVRLRGRFAEQGIGPDRLIFLSEAPAGGHLAVYGLIDIALDTFPWNGHTTSCEALWMGVPVVTLYGEAHAGRMCASLLTRLGLGDLVAGSEQAYVDIAAALAADRDRLRGLRGTLRQRMLDSPVCDGEAFTRGLERAYLSMWEEADAS